VDGRCVRRVLGIEAAQATGCGGGGGGGAGKEPRRRQPRGPRAELRERVQAKLRCFVWDARGACPGTRATETITDAPRRRRLVSRTRLSRVRDRREAVKERTRTGVEI
jgi:hypothetical protein